MPSPGDGLAFMLSAESPGAVTAEPARWVGSFKAGARVAVEFAKIGVLAAALGLPLAWAVQSHLLPWLTRTAVAPVTIAPAPTALPAEAGPAAPAPTPEAQLTDEPPSSIIDLRIPTVTAADIPAARPWLWWGPTLVALAVAALWGVGAVAKREREVVRDSPAVRKALRDVFLLLTAANPTPRAIKRYQNRMRYKVERLRPDIHEPDWLDGLLHATGSRVGREWVPAAWFVPPTGPRIGEADLILFGAIEVFAPWAFEQEPDGFRRALEQGLVLGDTGKGIRREKQRAQLWERVRKRFAEQIGVEGWPKAENLALYAGFVRAGWQPRAAQADEPPQGRGPAGDHKVTRFPPRPTADPS